MTEAITIARLYRFARSRLTGPRAHEVCSLAANALATAAMDLQDDAEYYFSQAWQIAHVMIQRGEFHRARWNQDRHCVNEPCESGAYSHACGYYD